MSHRLEKERRKLGKKWEWSDRTVQPDHLWLRQKQDKTTGEWQQQTGTLYKMKSSCIMSTYQAEIFLVGVVGF